VENKTNIVTNSGLADLLDLDVDDLKSNGCPKPYRSDKPSKYELKHGLDSIIESDKSRERRDTQSTKPRAGSETVAVPNESEEKEDYLAFHGIRRPETPLQTEKPYHRVMLYLAAEGNNATEIAEKTGYSTVCVNNLLRQPWAAKKITQILEESGRSKVELVLKGAALAAVERLITEMDNPDARSSERTSAADKLLDRVYGKPNQPLSVKSEGKSLDQMSDAEIAAELEKIRSNRN